MSVDAASSQASTARRSSRAGALWSLIDHPFNSPSTPASEIGAFFAMRKRGPGHADELIESIDRLSLLARRGKLPGPNLCRLSERVPTKFARYETFVPWPKPWSEVGRSMAAPPGHLRRQLVQLLQGHHLPRCPDI
jgi:hypothetical protein